MANRVKAYRVVFFTKVKTIEIKWSYETFATSKAKAILDAKDKWYAFSNAHMLKANAEEMTALYGVRKIFIPA